ncbi:MAG: glycine cleavage system protein GcvH [Actinobacteria bacterium]|nr:glycine cleavage system protein GcvH [Actinomycetota bacterium]MCL5887614.1 glycine cleavage system protein GcvH [Actinomycetota bacterium]
MNPDDRSYHPEHEWVKIGEGGLATIGITDFAQRQLGEIVYVELPEVGSTISAGQVYGEVESVKSVSELYAPVTGQVVQVNSTLPDTPEIINSEPYGEGWIVKIQMSDPEEMESLMPADRYSVHVGEA